MATGPVYMNATPHHSKVRVSLSLSSPLFIAGQDVTGKMEMECRADIDVGIGLIMVELFAIQELNSRDHSASSTFLHTRRLFQGPGLPPSNAVEPHSRPDEPPFPPGYFPARRGTTSFFFRFPLPLSSPSSISFASGLAKLRYEVRASVGVSHRGEKRVVTDVAETEIVQCEDMDGAAAEHVVVGENGKMYVQGRVSGGRIVSGQQACLELLVRNHTSKKTTGLTLTLTRVLHLHNAATTYQVPLQFSDILCSQTFRGNEYCVQPGAEGVANLVFDVPKAARVVKGGIRENADDGEGGRRRTEPLFELQCILSVKIGLGIGHKDVVFEMQVQLSHPATVPAISSSEPYASPKSGPYPASPDAIYGHQSPRAMSPLFQLPNPHVTRSPGPDSIASSPPYPYASPPIPSSSASSQQYHPPPSIPLYTLPSPHQHLWSPPPPAISPLPYYFPNSQNVYFFPPPPVTLLPFAYPTRPSSAGVGQLHSTSPANGFPGVDAMTAVYPGIDQCQQKIDISIDSQSHSNHEADVPIDSGGEEGKGARASRISHHLRTSTRARSMSPTSHRFPTPSSKLPPTAIALHATSPRHRDGPPVLSPRPRLSPRNSFSADAAVNTTVQDTYGTARSERVDLLERLVDLGPGQEGKSVEDVLKDLERVKKEMEMDKTLPKLPAPSGKVEVFKKVSNVPGASEMFELRAPLGGFEKIEEDNPKKSVLRPSPMARRISSHVLDREQVGRSRDERGVSVGALRSSSKQQSNGLDALEKRLLLEVGTRKPGTSNHPTLFELGIANPAPAIPTQPDTGESEISSLALASNGSPDLSRDKAGQRVSSTSTPAYLPPTSRIYSEEKVKMERSVQVIADDKDRLLLTRKERLREDKSKEQEVVKLRKAAKGRVADWLGGIASRSDPNQEVDQGLNSQPLRRTDITDKISLDRRSLSDKTLVSVPSMPSTPLLKPVVVPPNEMKFSISPLLSEPSSPLAEPKSKPGVSDDNSPALDSPITSAASVPHKVAFSNSPRFRKPVLPLDDTLLEGNQSTPVVPGKVVGHSAKLQLPQGTPETRYDVRSARGGRGGITTSVAALWTSLAQDGNEDHVKPPPKPVTRKLVTNPAFLDAGKPKPIPTFNRTPLDPTRRQGDNTPTPVSSTTQPPQPRNFVKSASVPASVVPSHAKPYLSSTASLARPPTTLSKPKPPMLSSTLSESISEDTSNTSPPAFPRDMAFGKARLKDLIKKYQEAAS